jgi:hypothetical protein
MLVKPPSASEVIGQARSLTKLAAGLKRHSRTLAQPSAQSPESDMVDVTNDSWLDELPGGLA